MNLPDNSNCFWVIEFDDQNVGGPLKASGGGLGSEGMNFNDHISYRYMP